MPANTRLNLPKPTHPRTTNKTNKLNFLVLHLVLFSASTPPTTYVYTHTHTHTHTSDYLCETVFRGSWQQWGKVLSLLALLVQKYKY
jgi:hypothetical protein